ncbi:MAG: class I SAM-dependent methyltransferase, partial [Desulfobulbaceae bacterium]|nr:class I SAM-dependent methyltransferase [Desulfobulbaceae bacterium]
MANSNAARWFSDTAEDFASKYEHKTSFRERFDIWTRAIDACSSPENQVLDVGCGNGVFAFYAAEKNESVIGVDGGDEMIRLCDQRMSDLGVKNIAFLKQDINDLDQLDLPRADIVICSSVLEYLSSVDRSIKCLADLTRPGGILILSMPNKSSLFRKVEPILFRLIGRPYYYRFVKSIISDGELLEKLAATGY